ncbi:MAG: S-layer homology domain-containing protein, partial [Clostridiaceae bacterium]|nr:S-layer homology domain-containing protein [Clostridiaceae bacterium]
PAFNKVQLAFSDGQANASVLNNVSELNRIAIVNGIVEENNTALGYIAIYNPDGQANSQEKMIQIYNYTDAEDIEVIRNHQKSDIDSIEEGDTVFLKLDQDGYVISISAVSNYVVKYGKIVRKSPLSITVEYDNKEQEVFRINSQVIITYKGRKTNFNQLKDGDNVKLLLQERSSRDVLKEVTILEEVSNSNLKVYKGKVMRIDEFSEKLFAANLLLFKNGRWERAGIKGVVGFALSRDFAAFYDNRKVSISDVNNYFRNNEVYIAVKEGYGGQEQIISAVLRDEWDSEIIYNDSIIKTIPGSGSFNLAGDLRNITYTDESIIIKDQHLVSGLSIAEDDKVYVVVNRDNEGQYKASLIQVHNNDENIPRIYRGRIKSINEFSNFIVESYSVLEDFSWKFYNTPKTFDITFDTRILDENGIAGQEKFTPYGEESYIGKIVYVVADGLNATLISTAPYGSYIFKGEVYQLMGIATGQEGNIVEEPDEVYIVNVKMYDTAKRAWIEPEDKEAIIQILDNSIIIKEGKVIKPSQLEKGDKVRFIKRDASNEGDSYIIIVERG